MEQREAAGEEAELLSRVTIGIYVVADDGVCSEGA